MILNLEEGDSIELSLNLFNLTWEGKHEFVVTSAPRYGDVILGDSPTEKFTSEDLKRDDVLYVHEGVEIGKKKLTDRFSVSLDGDGEIDVEVGISPVDDFPPSLVARTLTVDEGGSAVLTTRHVSVSDKDTEDDAISCRLIGGPMFGVVEGHDGRKAESFAYSRLVAGEMSYRQSVHRGLEPREDGISILCSDPPNNTDPSNPNFAILPVTILPVDDEPPILSPGSLIVAPASETPLFRRVVDVRDEDTPLEKLVFQVEKTPTSGSVLEKKGPSYRELGQFGFEGLERAVYLSGDMPGQDDFVLSASDGRHKTTATIVLNIRSGEESAPSVTANEGLLVTEGQTGVIGPRQLHSSFGDLPPSEVGYTVNSLPLFGSLYLNSAPVEPGKRFAQSDVDAGLLCYAHEDPTSSMDVFVFDVSAGGAFLANQNFFITIKVDNSSYPAVRSKGATVEAGGWVAVDGEALSATDPHADASSIEYHVMSELRWGRLERVDAPGKPLLVFNHKDVLGGKVRYVHTGLSSRHSPEIVQFEVTDGHRSVFHSFSIDVIPPKSASLLGDVPPSNVVLRVDRPVTHLRPSAGGLLGTLITSGNLLAEEYGESPLTYVVTRPPAHGRLVNAAYGTRISNFTQGMW